MTVDSPDSLPEDEPHKDTADGGIPKGGDGIGIAADSELNTFEPEEDPDATEEPRRQAPLANANAQPTIQLEMRTLLVRMDPHAAAWGPDPLVRPGRVTGGRPWPDV